MAWLVVDKEKEQELICETKPVRNKKLNIWVLQTRHCMTGVIKLPKGSIEKLLGYKLTWEDEPVKI